MSVYSFKDVVASIDGPGGSINLAADAGASEEGISFAPSTDKNTMVIGAGGEGQHSLSANESGTATIKLLKTSPVNAQLMSMYNLQTLNSFQHGKNNIVCRDISRGDFISCEGAAFKKVPALTYGKDAGTNEWVFDVIKMTINLGYGSPEL